MRIGSFEFNLRELSGSMGDFGTLLPLAVGYVSLSAIDQRVVAVPVEGMAPTKDDARTGAYYLARTLYLATRTPPAAGARAFLDFAQGDSDEIVLSHHFSLLP